MLLRLSREYFVSDSPSFRSRLRARCAIAGTPWRELSRSARNLGLSAQMNGVFFFNDTATTEIYTLSLHDALPISVLRTNGTGTTYLYLYDPLGNLFYTSGGNGIAINDGSIRLTKTGTYTIGLIDGGVSDDHENTLLDSKHHIITYAVFCFKQHEAL